MSWATSSTATLLAAADPPDERGDRGLVRQVEAVERLVEQQQLAAGGRAPGRSAAAAARRRRARRSAGARTRVAPTSSITSATRAASRARPGRPGSGNAPAGAVEAEPDDVDAADPGAGVEVPPLRQVADPALRLARRPAEHRRRARRPAGSRPRITLSSVDLPAPFGPSTATNSPAPTVRSTSLQIVRPPSAHGRVVRTRPPAVRLVAHRARRLSRARPASARELARLPLLEAGARPGSASR